MSLSKFLGRMFGTEESEVADEFDELEPAVAPAVPAAGSERPQAPAADSGAPTPEAADLADGILAIINSQLPAALTRFIDSAAQRQWLAEELGPRLKAYEKAVSRAALAELTGDKAKIQAELDELRTERKEVSSKREEQKAALLSEQRQRRALAERNRDLEAKIAELDSEIEQHRLTISSLMNKLRVAEVAEGDAEASQATTRAMQAELEALRAKAAQAESMAAEANAKIEMADRLIAKADAEIATRDSALAEKDGLLAAKDSELAAMAERLAEAESAAALQQALEERRQITGEEAPAVDADSDSEPAPSRKRRGRPRKQQAAAAAAAAMPEPEVDSSADIEEVDWLLPGGVPAGHVGHVSDPEFGYQPPKQSPAPVNDAQLTLF